MWSVSRQGYSKLKVGTQHDMHVLPSSDEDEEEE